MRARRIPSEFLVVGLYDSMGRIRTETGKTGMINLRYFGADLQQQLSIAFFASGQ